MINFPAHIGAFVFRQPPHAGEGTAVRHSQAARRAGPERSRRLSIRERPMRRARPGLGSVSAALQSQGPALPAGARSTAPGPGIVFDTGLETPLAGSALEIRAEPALLSHHGSRKA